MVTDLLDLAPTFHTSWRRRRDAVDDNRKVEEDVWCRRWQRVGEVENTSDSRGGKCIVNRQEMHKKDNILYWTILKHGTELGLTPGSQCPSKWARTISKRKQDTN